MVLIGRNHVAPAKFEKNAFVRSEARRIRYEQFFPVFGDHNRVGRFFNEVCDEIFKVWSNHILRMVRKLCSQEFCEFFPRRPRYLRIERINALIEGFVVDGNVDIFGKTSNGTVDLRERGAALKCHRRATRHAEKALEHPADPNILLQVLRPSSDFPRTGLQYVSLFGENRTTGGAPGEGY